MTQPRSKSDPDPKLNLTCVFCRIVQGHSPAHVIYEDDIIMAFLDIAPMARGHTLVIPKQHCRDMLDTPVDVLTHLVTNIPWLARGILGTIEGASGFNIMQNNGSVAGQVVFHLHFHILPRRWDDGMFPHNKAQNKRTTPEPTGVTSISSATGAAAQAKLTDTNLVSKAPYTTNTPSTAVGEDMKPPRLHRPPSLTTEVAEPLKRAIREELDRTRSQL